MADPDIFGLLQAFTRLLADVSTELSPERGRLLFAAAGLKLLDTLGYAPPEPETPNQDIFSGVSLLT